MSQLSYKNKPYLSQNIIKALEFASIAHRNQARVGPDKVPYISHPAAVGMVLWKAGFTDEVVMAGILHDVIEDTDYTYDDIQREFGKQIADWVAEVSEDAALPHDEKKEQYLTQLAAASMEAKAVSAADLLANRYSMLTGLSKDHITWRNFLALMNRRNHVIWHIRRADGEPWESRIAGYCLIRRIARFGESCFFQCCGSIGVLRRPSGRDAEIDWISDSTLHLR
jgi:hypothetical protein